MTKLYNVEVKLNSNRWTLQKVFTRHTDALHYVKENSVVSNRYPFRVIRVTRTVVFDGEK